MQPRRVLAGLELIEQGPCAKIEESLVAFPQFVSKDWFLVDELAAHSPPLRSLATEDEDGPRPRAGPRQWRLFLKQKPELPGHLLLRAAGRREPVLGMMPSPARREADIPERVVGPPVEEVSEVACDDAQGFR